MRHHDDVTAHREPDPADGLEDLTITCCDCGQDFVWTAGQRQFFRDRDLQQPRRCPDCRGARRAQSST
jgi:hypothetical protein